MMSQRVQIIVLGLLAFLLIGLIVFNHRPVAPEPPRGAIYYTGPRRVLYDPNKWVDANGNVVPPPPGAKILPPRARRTPGAD